MTWLNVGKVKVTLVDQKGRQEVITVDTTYGDPVIRILTALAKRVGGVTNLRIGWSLPGKTPALWTVISQLNGSFTETYISGTVRSLFNCCCPEPGITKSVDMWLLEHGKKLFRIEKLESEVTEAPTSSAESVDTEGTFGTHTISATGVTTIGVSGYHSSLI